MKNKNNNNNNNGTFHWIVVFDVFTVRLGTITMKSSAPAILNGRGPTKVVVVASIDLICWFFYNLFLETKIRMQ